MSRGKKNSLNNKRIARKKLSSLNIPKKFKFYHELDAGMPLWQMNFHLEKAPNAGCKIVIREHFEDDPTEYEDWEIEFILSKFQARRLIVMLLEKQIGKITTFDGSVLAVDKSRDELSLSWRNKHQTPAAASSIALADCCKELAAALKEYSS